jgi:hypothetical protein
LGAILVNVKGRRRREMIRVFWKAGAVDQLEKDLLLDCVSEEQRTGLGKVHPSFMGGEYLPDYAEGEVEIARIELESTTADVSSIRAKSDGERIAYSIVDEYETEYNVCPRESAKPLTLTELIAMIDVAKDGASLGTSFTLGYYSGRSLEDLNRIRSFTRVESVFYPLPSLHYEKVRDLWYEEEKTKFLGGSAETSAHVNVES